MYIYLNLLHKHKLKWDPVLYFSKGQLSIDVIPKRLSSSGLFLVFRVSFICFPILMVWRQNMVWYTALLDWSKHNMFWYTALLDWFDMPILIHVNSIHDQWLLVSSREGIREGEVCKNVNYKLFSIFKL